MVDFSKKSTYNQITTALALYSKLVPISALVLYCSVVWLASVFYEEIHQDIISHQSNQLNQGNIRRWKYSITLINELIEQINQCFGLILLISISHFFVDLIAHSFSTVTLKTKSHFISVIINMISKFVILWFVAFVPVKISHNVSFRNSNNLINSRIDYNWLFWLNM